MSQIYVYFFKMSKHGRRRTNHSTQLINNAVQSNKNILINNLNINESDFSDFVDKLYEYIDYDVQMIKECPEKSICENYADFIKITLNNKDYKSPTEFLDALRTAVRNQLANIYAPDISFDDTIDK